MENQEAKTEIVGYLVKVAVMEKDLPFDDMLAVYQYGYITLWSGDDSICSPLSVYWKPHIFKGLDFRYPPGFKTVEEAERHYTEGLLAPDGISVQVNLPGDVDLSRDVTLYCFLIEITRHVTSGELSIAEGGGCGGCEEVDVARSPSHP